MKQVEAFLSDRELRGLSRGTIRWYETFLRQWVRFGNIADPRARVRAFLDHYSNPQTQAAAWRAIRAFTVWLSDEHGEEDWTKRCHLRFAPAPHYQPLTISEFQSILSQLGSSFCDRRDATFYAVLFYTGARRDAIRLLRVSDCHLESATVRIRTKGRKALDLYLPPQALNALSAWLDTVHDWVFPHPCTGKPISGGYLSHRWKALGKQAGLTKRVWLHGLRHAAISHWLANGVSLAVAQKQAGHSSPIMTMRYNTVDSTTLRRELDGAYR